MIDWEQVRIDVAISDEGLMNGEPQYRRGKMCGQYNMMYSEDLY